jgi:hypothetical protein
MWPTVLALQKKKRVSQDVSPVSLQMLRRRLVVVILTKLRPLPSSFSEHEREPLHSLALQDDPEVHQ